MTEQEFRNLMVGDVIRHQIGSPTYIVTDNDGSRVTVVRSTPVITATNPSEWELVKTKKERDES